MPRIKFLKNKTYYLQGEQWKLKYIGDETTSLGVRYHFKVTEHNDSEEDWDEYLTGDGSEILTSRKEWIDGQDERVNDDAGRSTDID